MVYLLFFLNSFIFCEQIFLTDGDKVAGNVFLEFNTADDEFMVKNVDIVQENNIDALYIYNLEPKGFILISADDNSYPYVGYSFENNFKINNMPIHLEWVINKYKKGIISRKYLQSRAQDISDAWNKYQE